jgi:lipopolysaccharide export system permease protein
MLIGQKIAKYPQNFHQLSKSLAHSIFKAMKRILDRYLAGSYILPFIISTVFFVIFLLTFQLFRLTDLIISKGASLAYTLGLIYHISLTFLPMAIPLSVLFATLFVFNRLSNDSEYVALRSFGLQKHHIFMPFILVSLMIGITTYFLTQELAPNARWQFEKAIREMKASSLLSEIKSGQFFTSIPGVTLFAEKVEERGKVMDKIVISVVKDDSNQVIMANSGSMQSSFNTVTREERLTLELNQGNIVTDKGDGNIEKILFANYSFPIGESRLDAGFATKASMMSERELRHMLNKGLDQALIDYGFGKMEFYSAKIEYWARVNTPFLCLAFAFIGFVLGVSDTRGNSSKAGINLIILIGYYAVYFFFVGLARKGQIPPQLAVFIPTFIVFFIGHRYYRKLDWLA